MKNAIPDELLIHTDKDRLQRVMLNLISNALKFCRIGKQVIIRSKIIESIDDLSTQDEGFMKIVHDTSEYKWLEVQVQDEGNGIK